MTWGIECIVDCKGCDLQSINSLNNIKEFMDELIKKTNMKKMGELHSHYLEDIPEHREKGIVGWSVCQFIQTSSVVIHLCEDHVNNTGSLYLNFFSCKAFEPDDVISLLIKYFKCTIWKKHTIKRDADGKYFI